MADPIYTKHLKPSKTPLVHEVFISVKDGVAHSIWTESMVGTGFLAPDLREWAFIPNGDSRLPAWKN